MVVVTAWPNGRGERQPVIATSIATRRAETGVRSAATRLNSSSKLVRPEGVEPPTLSSEERSVACQTLPVGAQPNSESGLEARGTPWHGLAPLRIDVSD